MEIKNLTKELCNEFFEYADGKLIRKKFVSSRAKVGDVVGCMGGGRLLVWFFRQRTAVSRIIFLMHHGYMPEVVDHIDRNPQNNHIENLRAATITENNRNKSKAKNKTSQYNGVCINTNKFKKWSAGIVVFKKRISIGSFYDEDEAALAYNRYAVKYFGEFANLNIIKPKV